MKPEANEPNPVDSNSSGDAVKVTINTPSASTGPVVSDFKPDVTKSDTQVSPSLIPEAAETVTPEKSEPHPAIAAQAAEFAKTQPTEPNDQSITLGTNNSAPATFTQN